MNRFFVYGLNALSPMRIVLSTAVENFVDALQILRK